MRGRTYRSGSCPLSVIVIAVLPLLAGCVTGTVTPEHKRAFEAGKAVRLIYGNPSSHVVDSPPAGPSPATIQQFQRAWRFAYRTKNPKEPGKDERRHRELTEIGPGSEVFFASRFLQAVGLRLAPKGTRADAEITVATVVLRHGGTAARYLTDVYLSTSRAKSIEKQFLSDGDDIEEAFEQAGFYTGFGEFCEQLCGRERVCNAWVSLLQDREISHELIYLAAIEALGRLQTEAALSALRTAESQHANPFVREKAKAALASPR